jgi:choline transport protein
VFTETANSSGWDNMVIPWLLGLLQSAFSFIGVDVVFHISEEMPRADVEGPKILNMTIVIGGISGLFILLSMLFAIDDLEAILDSVYG